MKIIDLSMPILSNHRWPVSCERVLDFKKGDPFQSTTFTMSAHAFTHIDAPLHIAPISVELHLAKRKFVQCV